MLAPHAHSSPAPQLTEAVVAHSRQFRQADALVRAEFHRCGDLGGTPATVVSHACCPRRIGTQVLLANVPSVLLNLGGSASVWRAQGAPWSQPWSPLQLQRLLCGLACLSLVVLAGTHKVDVNIRAGAKRESIMKGLVRCEVATYFLLNLCAFWEFHSLPHANCPALGGGVLPPQACAQRFFWSFHTAMIGNWVVSQLTVRFLFAPEVLRNCLYVAATLALVHRQGALTPGFAATVVLQAALCFLYTCLVAKLCRRRGFEDRHMPKVETCPGFLMPAREALVTRLEKYVANLLDEPVLSFNVVAGIATGSVLTCLLVFKDDSLHSVSLVNNVLFLALLSTALLGKVLGGTTTSLARMVRRLGMSLEQQSLFELDVALKEKATEQEMLEVAMNTARYLVPDATAIALCTFPINGTHGLDEARLSSGTLQSSMRAVEVWAANDRSRAAMGAALAFGDAPGTSVAFVCGRASARRMMTTAWSGDFPPGMQTFTDWRGAAASGLAEREDSAAVTAPLANGHSVVGYLTAHFARTSRNTGNNSERLWELCETVGSCVAVKRAQDVMSVSQAILEDIYPSHVAGHLLEERTRGGLDSMLDELGGPVAPIMPGRTSQELRRPSTPSASSSSGGADGAAAAAAVQLPPAPSRIVAPRPQPDGFAAREFLPRSQRDGSLSPTRLARPRRSSPPPRQRHSEDGAVLGDRSRSSGVTLGAPPTPMTPSGVLYAEAYESVTVIFADVVGFTSMAQALQPAVVMGFLDELFSLFDELSWMHGTYKVETIGDAYMAVAGMNPRREDHAAVALRFAVALHDAAAQVLVDLPSGGRGSMQIRVGIHSGPVTAGLIGRTRARYCLFGDAVNIASRMESTGQPGAVQTSMATLVAAGLDPQSDLVKQVFELRTVNVKGHGPMDTALLRADSAGMASVLSALPASSEPVPPSPHG